MSSKLYVGNLSYSTQEAALEQFFAEFGPVVSVRIAKDKFSGQPRGFAFVELENSEKAQQAVTALSGKDLDGRTLNIDIAREPRPGGGGHGGGGHGGGGGDFRRGGGGGGDRPRRDYGGGGDRGGRGGDRDRGDRGGRGGDRDRGDRGGRGGGGGGGNSW